MYGKSRTIESGHSRTPKSLSKTATFKKTPSEKGLRRDVSLKCISHKPSVDKIAPVYLHSPKLAGSKSQKSLVQGFAPIKRMTLDKKSR